jgi:GNAT superfamily N-acetyltransferase
MIYLDPARRGEAIEAGWRAYAERVPGMEAAYRAACEGWRVIAVVADSVIGALFARDGVIHLGIVPEWRGRWASRRLIREMLSYGKTTTLLPNEADSRDFIGRIGFVKANKEGSYVVCG